MSHPLVAAARRLEDWIKRDAMPLWLAVGMAPEPNAHYERLLPNGRPDLSADIRVRVQARQAMVYAIAYYRGWASAEASSMAARLLDFLNTRAAHPKGGYMHLMGPDFQIKDSQRDLYDHAFYLLANTWCYRALGNQAALQQAELLVNCMDHYWGADHGGWLEGDEPTAYRRQNPHMHLFEAFLSLYEATRDSRWLARAGEIFTLFETRFYDPERRVVFEYFQADWRRAEGALGMLVEPGHMLEWVWLLDRYQRHSGRPVRPYTRALYEQALALGMTDSGLILDQVSLGGETLAQTKRCWPMTELIKASLVMARDGDRQAEERASLALHQLFNDYLCARESGAYIDQRGAEDEVLVDTAPASTLYHLVVLGAELSDYAQGLERLRPIRCVAD